MATSWILLKVDRTPPHPLTWLQNYNDKSPPWHFVGNVHCVGPHHQILVMTRINTGCIPITHRVDCKDKRFNFNKNEGEQRQIKPLQQHFCRVQCIFQHFAKREIWDLLRILYFVCERVLTATIYIMLVLGENWKVR